MRITLSDQKFLPLFDTIIETHLMNTFNVMPNYLTVSNNTILVRVLDTGIVYISSDGSYTTMKLINGEEYTFSFNLSAFEKIIEQQLKDHASIFIRVGRNLVINSNFIYVININKQELILADTKTSAKFILHVSKEALKVLKSLVEKSII